MHVISPKKLRQFWETHADAEKPLREWLRIVKHAHWRRFADVRAVYPHADAVGNKIVFNIGGNKVRLIAAIHFNRERVFIRNVLTHKEYDRGDWKLD